MPNECQQIETYISKIYNSLQQIFERENTYNERLDFEIESYTIVYDEFLSNQKKLQQAITIASNSITELEVTLRSLKHAKARMEAINNRGKNYDLDINIRDMELENALCNQMNNKSINKEGE